MAEDRVKARRIFEETLRKVQQQYVPVEDFIVDAKMTDATGNPVVVARYKIYADGHFTCFQILDEVLWPSL
jgi:hypothetical protein